MMLSSIASGVSVATPTVVATDPQNDVEEYIVTNNVLSYNQNVSKPEIDIVSVAYGLDSNSNATVALTLAGTPTPNNNTYYVVIFGDDAGYVLGMAWAGAYVDTSSSSSDCASSCTLLFYNTTIGYLNDSATISGNTITWTFPSIGLDYTQYANVSIPMPATANATWTWTVETVENTGDFYGNVTNGNWWIDTLDTYATDTTGLTNGGTNGGTNSGTDTNSTTGGKSSPGFDFIPVISFVSIASVAVIFERRRKHI